MKYLLYYIDGFIKKFPLKKKIVTIGRGDNNDLMIEDDFFSRNHLQIEAKDQCIIIRDLGSTNGTYVNNAKIKDATINMNDSFTLGGIEFFLKKGSVKEFKPVKELIPIFTKIQSENEQNFKKIETRYIQDIYNETLKQVIKSGLKKSDFNEFILELSQYLANLTDPGGLFIVQKEKRDFNILISVKSKVWIMKILKKVLKDNPKSITQKKQLMVLEKKQGYFYSFPIKMGTSSGALIYIVKKSLDEEEKKLNQFLSSLSREIELLSQILIEKNEPKNFQDYEVVLNSKDSPEIIVGDEKMGELIKQSRKIASCDLFVLIQGESGTGKELFARLIHNYSKRNKHKFIAINCAAIPENLLESELFGYEKGAFTGAYLQKKGKLELASGGTLVLDEIGNMSINLQSKLLRALQEHEFYRLAGSAPIRVDLRIISLTNSDINGLLAEQKFREDLYYRLAHHIISIPPLRERKDDISVLINHFTQKFSQRIKKSIRGYSIKAFEILQKYNWPGNVRQLENEINRLVNLVDHNELIGYDLISEAIKFNKINSQQIIQSFSGQGKKRNEKEVIASLLKKNDWNKSKTARDLNMTYMGLHKKMKRLGIKKA